MGQGGGVEGGPVRCCGGHPWTAVKGWVGVAALWEGWGAEELPEEVSDLQLDLRLFQLDWGNIPEGATKSISERRAV